MPAWVWGFIMVAGALFALKLIYVMGAAMAIRITGGALFTSTAGTRIQAFLDAVPMGKHDLLVDLGCGDGRVFLAARRRFGVRAMGFEVNPWAYLMARIRCGGVKDIKIRREDFWRTHLGDATVVFCYLFPDVMTRLANKLKAELRPGAVVVSANFPVPGWDPQMVLNPDPKRHGDPIYVYGLGASGDFSTIGPTGTVHIPLQGICDSAPSASN